MSDQAVIRDHRAAIALNNMGVSLLERRAYRQGMETLKDAIFVMKRVFRPQAAQPAPFTTYNSEAKVDRAIQRMANPQPVPSSVNIDVISHDEDAFHQSMDSVLREGAASPFAFPIRIESGGLDCPEDRDPDLESAIMLYNFAISHLCMSKLAKSPRKLQEGAIKLFNMAYSIISIKNSLARLADGDLRRLSETRLLLAVVVLNNVVKVLTEMGKLSEAHESYQKLVRLGTAINQIEDNSEPFEGHIPAAAAA